MKTDDQSEHVAAFADEPSIQQQAAEPRMGAFSEQDRLRQLRALPPTMAGSQVTMNRLLQAVAEVFEVPLVRLNLVEEDQQVSIAGVGDGPPMVVPRGSSVCTHTIQHEKTLIVPDLRFSDDFHDHSAVVGYPWIRFYAGAILRAPEGAPVGSLCLMDYVPRTFTAVEEKRLVAVATVAESLLTGRTDTEPLEVRSVRDPETGLLARDHLVSRLEAALEAARDEKHPSPLTLVTIYLDDVAALRAAGSTSRGRELLRAVAGRLSHTLPVQAEMGHWNADELLIWAPATVSGCDRDGLSATLSEALAQPIPITEQKYRVNASIAMLRVPEDGEELEELSSIARGLIRRTRASGRVSFIRQTAGRVGLIRQIDLSERLDAALEQGLIRPYLQPRISLREARISGMEALARWYDEGLGWVSPAEFVPLAERTGRSGQLTEAILEAVCASLCEWQKVHLPMVPIAVNVAPEEMLERDFSERVRAHLRHHGIAGSLLELEITERGLAEERDSMGDVMRDLARDDVRFAIDDFGTGYSSLAYLKDLPVHQLKIDRSFVGGVTEYAHTASIVDAMIGMAAALGLETIAEGVEKSAQGDHLRNRGVDHAQGYYFYRPIPIVDAGSLLERAHKGTSGHRLGHLPNKGPLGLVQ